MDSIRANGLRVAAKDLAQELGRETLNPHKHGSAVIDRACLSSYDCPTLMETVTDDGLQNILRAYERHSGRTAETVGTFLRHLLALPRDANNKAVRLAWIQANRKLRSYDSQLRRTQDGQDVAAGLNLLVQVQQLLNSLYKQAYGHACQLDDTWRPTQWGKPVASSQSPAAPVEPELNLSLGDDGEAGPPPPLSAFPGSHVD